MLSAQKIAYRIHNTAKAWNQEINVLWTECRKLIDLTFFWYAEFVILYILKTIAEIKTRYSYGQKYGGFPVFSGSL